MPEQERPQTLDLAGDYIEHLHLLSSDDAGWDKLNLIYEEEPAGEMPGAILERHMVVICLGNFRASFQLNGKWQHQFYTPGDVVIFPANEPFPTTQIDREVELIELFVDPALLCDAVGECVDKPFELLPHWQVRDPLIYQMGIALKTELESGGIDSQLYAESMATALSAHLLQRYSSRKPEIRHNPGRLPHYKLKRALAYIYDHLDQSLTLAELAAFVQMSPHYFASLFKQSTGFTPHQYITQCRIEKAKQLLRQKYLPIIEISQQVGFQNQSHFTRVFRQYTQTTPKAYRNSL